jgi:4-oxalocrotonate tautomerase
MPLIQIHMLEGRTKEQKKALLEAVTKAVQKSLDVPPASIRVWIQDIPPDEFMAAGKLKSQK